MVLEIINTHVHSFSVVVSQEEALVLDSQGIAILKELMALIRPKPNKDDGEDKRPPSAAEILDHIKAALERASTRGPRSTPPSRNGSGCCAIGSFRTPRTPWSSCPKRSRSPVPS